MCGARSSGADIAAAALPAVVVEEGSSLLGVGTPAVEVVDSTERCRPAQVATRMEGVRIAAGLHIDVIQVQEKDLLDIPAKPPLEGGATKRQLTAKSCGF
jgi:hypothetical protein